MRGFALIELTVVVTIIGLIAGGVLLGVNLLKAAELRRIGSDAEIYISAVNNFQDRYNSLPGDMHNAAHLWGAKAGGGADGLDPACYTFFDPSHTPTKSTCNGNGNGKIAANVASGNDFFENCLSVTFRLGYRG